jgi:hypothetical protein
MQDTNDSGSANQAMADVDEKQKKYSLARSAPNMPSLVDPLQVPLTQEQRAQLP